MVGIKDPQVETQRKSVSLKQALLERKIAQGREALSRCRLCGHFCGVNRLAGQRGFCEAGLKIRLYKYKIHFGEEPPISGHRGSGILFLSGCTMRCVYCQNFPMSHRREGVDIGPERLAHIMLQLQRWGVHNINLVTATHYIPQILEALELAYRQGLTLPIVYNTNGFESPEALELLEGIVDVYLPDMKYTRREYAKRYSSAPNYPAINRQAIREMYRQVGLLQRDSQGIAIKGLIVRHLLLPGFLSGTPKVLEFLAQDLSPEVHISLMSQYLPIWGARKFPELSRRITREEFELACEMLEAWGFHNGWIQTFEGN